MNERFDPAFPQDAPPAAPTPPEKRSRAGTWVLLVVGLAALGGAAWWIRGRTSGPTSAGGPAGSASAHGAMGADRVVPVVVATVSKKDVPIWLEGLGTVVPIATVTVKTQVDGRLERVGFVEGQQVKKGDLLAQIDPRPFVIQLHTAEAALARDNATLRNANLNLERYKTLRSQNLIPQQQVDDQQTVADQAGAAVMADQAQADAARLNLDYARIVSPIDGVTGVRLVDPGNLVHASDPTGIVLLTQLDPIAVLFTLPEDDLPRVSSELAKGEIAVEAYSRDGAQKLATGKLALIDNQVNAQTATIRLKARFDNPDRALWPNAFVKARMLLTTKKDAVVMPATVVQRGPEGSFAYLVDPATNTVSMRHLEIETTAGDLAVVAKGLEPGDVVVSDGQSQLRPGSKVQPRTPEQARAAANAQGAGSAVPAGSAAPEGSASGAPGPHAPGAGAGAGGRRGAGKAP